jgi:hypothetical protein
VHERALAAGDARRAVAQARAAAALSQHSLRHCVCASASVARVRDPRSSSVTNRPRGRRRPRLCRDRAALACRVRGRCPPRAEVLVGFGRFPTRDTDAMQRLGTTLRSSLFISTKPVLAAASQPHLRRGRGRSPPRLLRGRGWPPSRRICDSGRSSWYGVRAILGLGPQGLFLEARGVDWAVV